MTASVTHGRALRYAGGSARGLLHNVRGRANLQDAVDGMTDRSIPRASVDYTGTMDAACVLGAGVANTILASEPCSPKQAGHLRASDQVRSLLSS